MSWLIDSSLWIDYFRPKTPRSVKAQIIPFVDSDKAALCDPVRFEILRGAHADERAHIQETLSTLPMLFTPAAIWDQVIVLGQRCIDSGHAPPALDLIIAAICLANDAEIVTFDADFGEIARVSPLKVRLLTRC